LHTSGSLNRVPVVIGWVKEVSKYIVKHVAYAHAYNIIIVIIIIIIIIITKYMTMKETSRCHEIASC